MGDGVRERLVLASTTFKPNGEADRSGTWGSISAGGYLRIGDVTEVPCVASSSNNDGGGKGSMEFIVIGE